jgi:biopolymer transport protein ExbB
MKRSTLIFLAVLALASTSAQAQDMREAYRKAEDARILEESRAVEKEEIILANRVRLERAVIQLEQEQAELERLLTDLDAHIDAQKIRNEELEDEWSRSEMDFKEISGNVRLAARDVETMLHQSPFSAFDPERVNAVSPLLDKGYFPDIDDISGMTRVLFEEIALSGQVGLREGTFVARDGTEQIGAILTLGKFTSAYKYGEETGFLNFSPEGRRFVAMSTLPKGSIGRHLKGYLKGDGEKVPIDLSGGNALAQITHQTSIVEQFEAGGPIVWPILGLAVAALLIVVTRIIFLNRIHANTDRFMGEVNEMAAKGDWAAAEDLVERNRTRKSPVISVIQAGLAVRNEDRETQESVLQEAILHQLPRVEKGLSVLAVLGAVAPLLGLLGTVTGMINTFRVITLFGTGDPKLMSGGISEALVTTELGLAVAIPIMLLHTFLSRRADHIVGDMEEKAVQMTNIIQIRKQNSKMMVAEGGSV